MKACNKLRIVLLNVAENDIVPLPVALIKQTSYAALRPCPSFVFGRNCRHTCKCSRENSDGCDSKVCSVEVLPFVAIAGKCSFIAQEVRFCCSLGLKDNPISPSPTFDKSTSRRNALGYNRYAKFFIYRKSDLGFFFYTTCQIVPFDLSRNSPR